MPEIWKFNLPTHGRTSVEMPIGAKLLTVQEQRGELMLWACVDPRTRVAPWRFDVRMTGEAWRGDIGTYVGTVQLGPYVAHVFSLGNGPGYTGD